MQEVGDEKDTCFMGERRRLKNDKEGLYKTDRKIREICNKAKEQCFRNNVLHLVNCSQIIHEHIKSI